MKPANRLAALVVSVASLAVVWSIFAIFYMAHEGRDGWWRAPALTAFFMSPVALVALFRFIKTRHITVLLDDEGVKLRSRERVLDAAKWSEITGWMSGGAFRFMRGTQRPVIVPANEMGKLTEDDQRALVHFANRHMPVGATQVWGLEPANAIDRLFRDHLGEPPEVELERGGRYRYIDLPATRRMVRDHLKQTVYIAFMGIFIASMGLMETDFGWRTYFVLFALVVHIAIIVRGLRIRKFLELLSRHIEVVPGGIKLDADGRVYELRTERANVLTSMRFRGKELSIYKSGSHTIYADRRFLEPVLSQSEALPRAEVSVPVGSLDREGLGLSSKLVNPTDDLVIPLVGKSHKRMVWFGAACFVAYVSLIAWMAFQIGRSPWLFLGIALAPGMVVGVVTLVRFLQMKDIVVLGDVEGIEVRRPGQVLDSARWNDVADWRTGNTVSFLRRDGSRLTVPGNHTVSLSPDDMRTLIRFAEERLGSEFTHVSDTLPKDELEALYRASLGKPPTVELVPGVRYRYIHSSVLRKNALADLRLRIASSFISLAAPVLVLTHHHDPLMLALIALTFAVHAFVVTSTLQRRQFIALFGRQFTATEDGLKLDSDGRRYENAPATSFWNRMVFRDAEVDRYRSGSHSIYVDRRFLVPVDQPLPAPIEIVKRGMLTKVVQTFIERPKEF